MRVDFFNFEYAPRELKDSWNEACRHTIEAGTFIGGNSVSEFENRFSRMVGTNFAVGVSNGYDGLELSLIALGVGKGQKVAVPAHTFIATWNAVISTGGIPIGVDVDDQGQIDINAFSELIKIHNIVCVIPVHMHGHLGDLKTLRDICSERGIFIVEDASQAHMGVSDGLTAGSVGDIGVFSLYPTKNLGALGDAGVAVTNSAELATRLRRLSNYGSSEKSKYHHLELGFNRRLDALQARILCVNLEYIDVWNSHRKNIALRYANYFDTLGVEYIRGSTGSVWHHFCIFSKSRERLRSFLKEQGVGTEIHYPYLAAHEAENFIKMKKGHYPMAERFACSILSLPISPFHTIPMIDSVCEVISNAKDLGYFE